MDTCSRRFIDSPVSMKQLGQFSLKAKAPECAPDSGKSVAIIGGGPGGLSAAWQLRLKGHNVTVYEADKHLGGKLWQVIPSERLPADILEQELERILSIGVETKLNCNVDSGLFAQIRADHDAVIIATGAHNPVVIPFPGHERLIKGLDFLKRINAGDTPDIGKKVVVIGAGNAGMDVVLGAYRAGAEQVTAIDVQRPAAYQKEIDHVTSMGAKIRWPVYTSKISAEGLHTKDGELIKADTVIISIGERPDLSFAPSTWISERGMMNVNGCWQVEGENNVFAIGDTTSPGLLTHAIGHGHEAADQCNDLLNGRSLTPRRKLEVIPQTRLSKELFRPRKTGQLQVIDAREESGRCISCGTCRDCYMCLEACPEGAISRVDKENGDYEYISDPTVCIGCGICAGICPCGIWGMEHAV
jgi:NADPH-dependent glutamate synthase beta subunit-like oxidoreductase/Pyruvate/2-oxoacid:ferredoxin oxidoreductase delta subunit